MRLTATYYEYKFTYTYLWYSGDINYNEVYSFVIAISLI